MPASPKNIVSNETGNSEETGAVMMRKLPAPEVAARFRARSEQKRKSSARAHRLRGRTGIRFRVAQNEVVSQFAAFRLPNAKPPFQSAELAWSLPELH